MTTPQQPYNATKEDSVAKIWNVETGKCIKTLQHDKGVTSAVYNGACTLAATSSYDLTVKIWDLEFLEICYSKFSLYQKFLVREISKVVYLRKLVELRAKQGKTITSLDVNERPAKPSEITFSFNSYEGNLRDYLIEAYKSLPEVIQQKLDLYMEQNTEAQCAIF